MYQCARCITLGIETEALHYVRAVEYYHPVIGAFVKCENDGAYVCSPCLEFTKQQPSIKIATWELSSIE
jgi:hypothetical protein